MSEPLSSPTLSSSASSFDMPSPPTYDSDDEIVWSLSSSSISTGSSNDFVVLSRALSPSNATPETPSPDSVSESSSSDLSFSVDSLSSSHVSASVPASSLPPPLPLIPSRILNVDYPTPTATPTPRITSQSAPALIPSLTVSVGPTKAQLKRIRKAAEDAKLASEEHRQKLLRKAAAVVAERKALAQKATAKAQSAQARAQAVKGKGLQQVAQEKKSADKVTKKARRARKSARKAEKNLVQVKKTIVQAEKAAKAVAKAVNAVQTTAAKVKKQATQVVRTAKKSPPTTPKAATISVGLGSRPVINDSAASEVASEKGDDPSSFAEASQFITSYINDPQTAQTKSKVHRLALLQSIIVEFGVGTTSMLPRTITAAKAFVKSTVFVNVQEYLTVRTQGQDALKRILLPSKKALIKDIRRTGPTPRTLVKQYGLQALLVLTH